MAADVKDFYKTLGVNKDASQDEIKKAFKDIRLPGLRCRGLRRYLWRSFWRRGKNQAAPAKGPDKIMNLSLSLEKRLSDGVQSR